MGCGWELCTESIPLPAVVTAISGVPSTHTPHHRHRSQLICPHPHLSTEWSVWSAQKYGDNVVGLGGVKGMMMKMMKRVWIKGVNANSGRMCGDESERCTWIKDTEAIA